GVGAELVSAPRSRRAAPLRPNRGHAAVIALLILTMSACSSSGPVLEPVAPPDPTRFAEVDRAIEAAVADGAFPGAVVAIGQHGRLLHLAAFGRQTYDPDAPAITTDTLFDIASLTKV